jgi:uracil-DNA glycosylase
LLGLPELSATSANREEAIQQVRARILEWIALGQLVPVEIMPRDHPVLRFRGWVDPNDPDEQAYLQELARMKAEDLERTLREYAEEDQRCSSSSSTPTT